MKDSEITKRLKITVRSRLKPFTYFFLYFLPKHLPIGNSSRKSTDFIFYFSLYSFIFGLSCIDMTSIFPHWLFINFIRQIFHIFITFLDWTRTSTIKTMDKTTNIKKKLMFSLLKSVCFFNFYPSDFNFWWRTCMQNVRYISEIKKQNWFGKQ